METKGTKSFDNWQFKRLRELLNLTQTDFAEAVGSSQQVINMIEKNNRGVPTSIREGFYRTYHIPYEAAIECETIDELNKASQLALTKREYDVLQQLISSGDNNIVRVKYYTDAKAAAGEGIDVPETSNENILYFDKRYLENIVGVSSNNAIIIQAKGNSMDSGMNKSNDIKDGDLLLVDVSVKEVINNKVFVIQQGNQLRVKRVKKTINGDLYLMSNNNKEYPDELVKEPTVIIGKVVRNCSKENI